MNSFQPYLIIQSNNIEDSTGVAVEEHEKYLWDDMFNLDFDQNSVLFLSLFDKDEYGSDTLIVKYIVSYSDVRSWKETKNVTLVVPDGFEEDTNPLKFLESFAKKEETNCVLNIEIKYHDSEYLSKIKADITNHKNIVRGTVAYTLYELTIKRNSGHTWKVELRYSDFYLIRDEISQVIPGITNLPFPQKTYFEWLNWICRCTSRFNENRIKDRKEKLNFFINVVLDNINEFSCEAVNRLLRIPN